MKTEMKKLFPFDPAKAQTITNPDGFPVYCAPDGNPKASEVAVFSNGSVACLWEGGKYATAYSGDGEAAAYLRLGPKTGKTVYLNCWVTTEHGLRGWATYDFEEIAKKQPAVNPDRTYYHIAIPVTGPEIEP